MSAHMSTPLYRVDSCYQLIPRRDLPTPATARRRRDAGPLETKRTISRVEIGRDTPLRLADAARIAFPDGSVSATGLRTMAKRGMLVIERLLNKDFTTLEKIEQMRQASCRAAQRS